RGVHAWRHRHSLTVVFPRPSEALARKWQIPVHGDIAHVCLLSHITREQLDALIDELAADARPAGPSQARPAGAAPHRSAPLSRGPLATAVGEKFLRTAPVGQILPPDPPS